MKLKDYEYVFCCSLHRLLKQVIKGKVYVTVKDDILYVEIHYKDLKYEMAFENFEYNWTLGIDMHEYVNAVVREYKQFIIDRYFHLHD